LEECLSIVQLNEDDDSVLWALTKNGQFSVASLYKHCALSGVIDVSMEEMWHKNAFESLKNCLVGVPE
jgi:hypothetical protein